MSETNKIGQILTFRDVKYVTVPEEKTMSCTGCALKGVCSFNIADELQCGRNHVILKEYAVEEKERTFTKDELIDIAVDYFYPCYGETSGLGEDVCRKDFLQHVDEFLVKEKLERDPDYQKYLELKKRFE